MNISGIPGSDPGSGLPGSEPIAGLPGSEPESPRRQPRLWIELVVAIGLAVLLGLLAIGFLVNAAGAHQHGGGSRAGQVLGAVISLGLLVLTTRWAIQIEHRLRGHQPVAQTFASAAVATEPKRRPARVRARPRRHYGPVATGIVLAIFAAGTIGFVIGAISSYSQGLRSGYVQHHGTRANAIVDSVDNTQHCSKSSCYYTAAIGVTLNPPVDGASTTVVHYPGFSDLVSGESVIVLVDPKQPGYAELPGSRFVTSWEWIILLVLAVLFAGLTVLDARALRTLLAHRREHLAGSSGSVSTAA